MEKWEWLLDIEIFLVVSVVMVIWNGSSWSWEKGEKKWVLAMTKIKKNGKT